VSKKRRGSAEKTLHARIVREYNVGQKTTIWHVLNIRPSNLWQKKSDRVQALNDVEYAVMKAPAGPFEISINLTNSSMHNLRKDEGWKRER
jgi:hypothetical protein